MKKVYIKIIGFSLIIITIFMFSVVLASNDSVYVWSNQTKNVPTNATE